MVLEEPSNVSAACNSSSQEATLVPRCPVSENWELQAPAPYFRPAQEHVFVSVAALLLLRSHLESIK